jgi:hypothetical protein
MDDGFGEGATRLGPSGLPGCARRPGMMEATTDIISSQTSNSTGHKRLKIDK